MQKQYDVIVIGGGHAGLEAAFAPANVGLKTALISLQKEGIGACPCNPSIGGPAKGIVTREIGVLGGMQAKASDNNTLQIKLLNTSKGAGVWALRAQVDIIDYHNWFLKEIEKNKNLDLVLDEVSELIVKNKIICGIKTLKHGIILAKKVIITTGTYMNSLTHIGLENFKSGPDIEIDNKKRFLPSGYKRSNFLSDNIKKLGFKLIRLKTGTPPRIKSDSINYKLISKETGDNKKLSFSYFNNKYLDVKKQLACYLTYTNEKTHKIIRDNIKSSAMYGGTIKGVGPRYCPSIEDKIVRFADKTRHQLFIEPVSKKLNFMYIQGLSTSLPSNVQEKMVKSIAGLENAKFVRYAYAIEYDAIDPTQLFPTLESKLIKGIYFGGQINGTSGYEEAAGQGLIAGINAILSIRKQKPLILKRDESYIGVMIDDIVTKGITDPYRLLTSRAEYRLFLRNDNADDRLIKYGYKVGLIKKETYALYLKQKKLCEEIIAYIKNNKLTSNLIKKYGSSSKDLYTLLKNPNVKLKELIPNNLFKKLNDNSVDKIEINVKFEGYIKKQNKFIDKASKYEKINIKNINYDEIKNLSLEARDKLKKINPLTIGQALRIQGININDIFVIYSYLKQK